MDNIYIWMGIFVFIGIFGYAIGVIIKYSRHKKLSAQQKKVFHKWLKEISAGSSPKHQIIDYDTLYHKILLGLGYKGSFGEILKIIPNEISDIEEIWHLHKIRNKLVHEISSVSATHLKEKATKYKKNINALLKKI